MTVLIFQAMKQVMKSLKMIQKENFEAHKRYDYLFLKTKVSGSEAARQGKRKLFFPQRF